MIPCLVNSDSPLRREVSYVNELGIRMLVGVSYDTFPPLSL